MRDPLNRFDNVTRRYSVENNEIQLLMYKSINLIVSLTIVSAGKPIQGLKVSVEEAQSETDTQGKIF